jgi:colanic acid/amylovoran biosynthesis glycosyltransferase
MRVAYLVNYYPAVTHTFIRREIHALERQGFEVFRLAIRGWDALLVDPEDQVERKRTRYILSDGILSPLIALLGMLVRRPLRLLRGLALTLRQSHRSERSVAAHLAYLAMACRVERLLRTAQVEHLHAHFGTNSADVAMLVHELGGPQWSFTVHGPEEFDKASMIGLAEKVRRCSFVVAVSSFGRSQLFRLVEHRYWRKVQVIHCGLECGSQDALVTSAPVAKRLICVGRLCEQKGQLLLIEAAHQLAALGLQFELVLAGDDWGVPPIMRNEIETLIRRYRLQDRVRITGWISGHEVQAEILASRALVLPSFAEGLPIVIMEAMALGRAIISTFVGGIPELVRPREDGWLVPAGDLNSLLEAMRDCLEMSDKAIIQRGENARERVTERHNVDTEVAKLARLLERRTDLAQL